MCIRWDDSKIITGSPIGPSALLEQVFPVHRSRHGFPTEFTHPVSLFVAPIHTTITSIESRRRFDRGVGIASHTAA